MIAGQSGVINNLSDGEVVFGMPAFNANKARRAYTLLKSLPEMQKNLRKLEKRVANVEKSKESD